MWNHMPGAAPGLPGYHMPGRLPCGARPAAYAVLILCPFIQLIIRITTRTDETGHRVGREGVQASVAETVHTTQIRIIPHRYAVTLRSIWGRIEDRPAMRDGTTGYGWHKGPLARCLVHLLRDTEESSMENELGSTRYDRHRMMLSVYRDAKQVHEQV